VKRLKTEVPERQDRGGNSSRNGVLNATDKELLSAATLRKVVQ